MHVEDHPARLRDLRGRDPGRATTARARSRSGITARTSSSRRSPTAVSRCACTASGWTAIWTLVPGEARRRRKELAAVRKKRRRSRDRRKPRTYRPMLATLADDVPTGEGWLFEVKWDGFRAIAYDPRAATCRPAQPERQRRSPSASRRSSAGARARAADADCVLDGEVCALGEDGRATFSAMQQGKEGTTYVYVAFDLLEVEGEPLVDLPLTERPERLAELRRREARTVQISETFDDGGALFEARSGAALRGRHGEARRLALRAGPAHARLAEGEDAGSPGARDRGLHEGAGPAPGRVRRARARRVRERRPALGRERRHGLRRRRDRPAARQAAAPARSGRRRRSPSRRRCRRVRKGDVVWVEPDARRRDRFAEWTHDGRLRAPSYWACATTRRQRKCSESGRRSGPRSAKGKRVLKLSNLDKPFWPDEGITKGDLLAYYRDVAPALLPHLRDRPFTMKRYPDGWNGKFFFQKDAPKHMPDWIPTRAVRGLHARPAAAAQGDRLPARERRAGAALDGEHGLHRHEHVVLAGRQARRGPTGCCSTSTRRRTSASPRRSRSRSSCKRDARAARPRRLPEDERLGGDPRPRPGRAAAHLRADARVLRDRRRRDRARASAAWRRPSGRRRSAAAS